MLNDTNYGHTSSIYYLYEFAYREIGGDKLLYVLKELYKDEARDNLEAFIYGVDILPTCDIVPTGNHIEEGSGNSILRGRMNAIYYLNMTAMAVSMITMIALILVTRHLESV